MEYDKASGTGSSTQSTLCQSKPIETAWYLVALGVLILAAAAFFNQSYASVKPDVGYAQSATPLDASDLVRKVFTASGLQAQIKQIPAAVQDGFDRSVATGEFEGRLPADALPALRQGFAAAFASERLERRILSIFEQALSIQDLASILDWHNSELGKKIESAELSHSNVSGAGDRATFLQSLVEDPLSESRLKALTELEDAWQVSKTSVDMMIDMQVAVTTALLSLMPEANQVPVSNIVAHYESTRPQLEEHFASETLFSMTYIYQGLSVEEIRQYTAFAHGDIGRRYVAVTNDALHRSMLEGSLELGKSMGDLYSQSHSTDVSGSGI